MIRTRPLMAGAAAVLSLGIGAPFAVASSGHGSDHAVPSTTPALAPTVVEAPASFTISLPRVGVLTFTVDPTSGLVSNPLATTLPTSGFTAGTPFVTPKFVAVLFTSTTGETRAVLIARIHEVHGSVLVTVGNDRALFRRIADNRDNDRNDNDNRTPGPVGLTGPSGATAPTAASSTGINAPKASSTQQGSSGDSGSGSRGGSSNGGHSGKD